MGIGYVGLNSLFASVLQVLNLAELGVGSAMVYSMYRPIAENDTEMICALMKLYRFYYRIISIVIAIAGSILIPFIPNLISGDVPDDINIYALYILHLGTTVLSYLIFAYRSSILTAHQRNDIISKVKLISDTVKYLFQFLVICFFQNYYLFVCALLFSQILSNVMTAVLSHKFYPQYIPAGKINKNDFSEINRRIKDIFTSKVGSVIYDSADTIVISAFLGLSALAVYQNYFFILTAVSGLINVIFESCTAGIGNSIVSETKEKNYNDFVKFTFVICWLSGFCSACLICLYQPFMKLWVGEDFMLPFSLVCLFVVYFFVRQINSLFILYKDASGIWRKDRFRPLISAFANLTLNLFLVRFTGLYGILLSTVSAIIFIGLPWLTDNLFTTIFHKNHLLPYLKKTAIYIFTVIISCVITYSSVYLIDTEPLWTLLIRFLACIIIPNTVFYLIFRKTNEFRQIIFIIDKMTKGKFF